MFNRRSFFRGTTLGVGGLYLGSLLRDLQAAQPHRPARVLFFIQGNGIYPAEIQPKGIERSKAPSVLEDRALDGVGKLSHIALIIAILMCCTHVTLYRVWHEFNGKPLSAEHVAAFDEIVDMIPDDASVTACAMVLPNDVQRQE